MTHISSKRMDPQLMQKIYDLFFDLVSRNATKKAFRMLVEDLLTPTEKTMIAKRVAIIYLLCKRIPVASIIDTLKVSRSTVIYYSLACKNEGLPIIQTIKNILMKENIVGFLDEYLADLVLRPDIYARNRWIKGENSIRRRIEKERGI